MPPDHPGFSETVRTELAALGEQCAPVERKASAGGTERPSCVLVVDDEADMRSFVRSCLEPQWQVEEAADGEDGLIRVTEVSPVLAIVDVRMPGMDGVAFAQALKTDAATHRILVVLISGQQRPADVSDAFLAKPFTCGQLRAVVNHLLASDAV